MKNRIYSAALFLTGLAGVTVPPPAAAPAHAPVPISPSPTPQRPALADESRTGRNASPGAEDRPVTRARGVGSVTAQKATRSRQRRGDLKGGSHVRDFPPRLTLLQRFFPLSLSYPFLFPLLFLSLSPFSLSLSLYLFLIPES